MIKEYPDFLDIQVKSFQDFFQLQTKAEEKLKFDVISKEI